MYTQIMYTQIYMFQSEIIIYNLSKLIRFIIIFILYIKIILKLVIFKL